MVIAIGRDPVGQAEHRFWRRRFGTIPGLRAVGHSGRSEARNRIDYERAGQLFLGLIREDFPDVARCGALEFGFGLGHYSRLCKQAGFQRYVGLDFASPARPSLGDGFRFVAQDVGEPFDLGERFDFVFAIDVIYHVLSDTEFESALDNLRLHATRRIYVTGLFETLHVRHCFHRPLERFERLGKLIDVQPWRDNKIARFAVD